MTPERWQQIDRILDAALDLEPAERAAFLATACAGDDTLRQDVSALLNAHNRAGDFIETPAIEIDAAVIAGSPRQLLAGHEIDRYQITALLGMGGMGEVYLAHDTKLGRKVALKLLPAQFTRDPNRMRRFQQEARAASGLNHPNILTIYEVGVADDVHFIATEFIEGETLRARISEHPLEPSAAVEIAVRVAEALEAAHEAKLAHRDIKPENIMIRRRDGYVKVLDFGLAKLTERVVVPPENEAQPAAKTWLKTEPGVMMGTAAYMSPEQLRGQSVDARTDLWSLGVVLFEMLTGRLPFSGETAPDVRASILRDEVPALPVGVPEELQVIVTRGLQKDRDLRYESSGEMLSALRVVAQQLQVRADAETSAASRVPKGNAADQPDATPDEVPAGEARATRRLNLQTTEAKARRFQFVSAVLAAVILIAALLGAGYLWRTRRPAHPQTPGEVKTLAVLPFKEIGKTQDDAYLGMGLADALITKLGNVRSLIVRPTSAVRKYSVTPADPLTVGRDLGVDAVLDGNIQHEGNRIRVTVQLLRISDGKPLWSETFNEGYTDIFTLQDSISAKVVNALTPNLSREDQARLQKRYTDNPEAYDAYLKGRYFWNKRNAEGFKKAIEFFRRATDLDPNYALAHAGLADTYGLFPAYTGAPPKDYFPQAKASAELAIGLDDGLAEAHASLGWVYLCYEWDWPGTEREFRRAIELNPNYAIVHLWYGFFLQIIGRGPESIEEIRKAQTLDPLSLPIRTSFALNYFYLHQYDQAAAELRKTLEINPQYEPAHYHLARIYLQQGTVDTAISEARQSFEISKGSVLSRANLALILARAGRRDEALKLFSELGEPIKQGQVPPYHVAGIHGALGNTDEAFVWLKKALEVRDINIPRLKDDPELDSLRQDPRMTEMLRQIKLLP